MKTCNQCNKNKSYSEFYKKSASKDGLQPKCKSCVKIINKNFREVKPEYQIEWQRRNPKKWLAYVNQWVKENVVADNSRSAVYLIIRHPYRLILH